MNARIRSTHWAVCTILLAAIAMSPSGCSKAEKAEKAEIAEKAEKPPEPAAQPNAEVVAKLAKADAFDGKVDKVVSKCANCALGMAGQEKHELEIEGYKMHFCGAGCLDHYKKEPAKTLLALKIPEK